MLPASAHWLIWCLVGEQNPRMLHLNILLEAVFAAVASAVLRLINFELELAGLEADGAHEAGLMVDLSSVAQDAEQIVCFLLLPRLVELCQLARCEACQSLILVFANGELLQVLLLLENELLEAELARKVLFAENFERFCYLLGGSVEKFSLEGVKILEVVDAGYGEDPSSTLIIIQMSPD